MKFSPLSLMLTIVSITLLAADLAVPGYGQVVGKAETQRFVAQLLEGGVSWFASQPTPNPTSPTSTQPCPSGQLCSPSQGASLVDWGTATEQ